MKYDTKNKLVISKSIGLNSDTRGTLTIPLYNSISFAAAHNANEDPESLRPAIIVINNNFGITLIITIGLVLVFSIFLGW